MTKLMRAMVLLSLSAVAISGGVFLLEGQEAKRPAAPHPKQWPGESIALADRQRETVVAFVHPRCNCAQASLDELQRQLKQHPKALAYVMFVRPSAMEEGWEIDAHWDAAAKLDGAVVLPDPGGAEQARFGAQSGEVLVYDPSGALEATPVAVASR